MSLKTALIMVTVFFMAANRGAIAQKLETGPQVLTIFSNIDDSEQPYALYLPKHFNPEKKYPLVIMLHGAFSNHRIALRRVFGQSNINGETDVEATRYFPKWRDVNFIVAAPLARGTMGYQGIAEKDVYDVLADVEKRFPIDSNRVYLTGLSMGGGGTVWLGLTRPDIWAAIAPVCPAAPPEAKSFAPNALNYPVSFHQGGADPVVNPQGTRDWVKLLKDLGTKVEYTEYPGVQHNCWEEAYKDEAMFKWFSKFRRNPFPDRVRFVTDRYEYDSAYWLIIDELTPGTFANVDAKFTGVNKIDIQASDLGAFTLNLSGHPKFRSSKPVSITVNGETMDAKTKDAVTLVLHDGTWSVGECKPQANAKRPGAEGPISSAFATGQVYVYGTEDNPPQQTLEYRRSMAEDISNWHTFLPLLFFPRVISDREVRPSDFGYSNLILFGTAKTNGVIKELSDMLPIHFKSADSTYGLVYIYPDSSHYVLVCAGKPWWSMDRQQSSHHGYRFFLAAAMLGRFGDYVMYKDSLSNVIATGRFDNQWRISPADSAKMVSTGCVTIDNPAK